MLLFRLSEIFYWREREIKRFFFFNFFFKKLFVVSSNVWLRVFYCINPLKVRIGLSEPRIVVTLTSYPDRINSVKYVLESLFRQTILPDRIILYLSSNQFADITKIYDKFKKYSKCGFELIFVDGDLGPHKKYFYAFQSFPISKVITVDDDIIYGKDFIEMFISEKSGCSVIANICCDYCLEDDQGKLCEYKIPIGAGGVMYNLAQMNLSGLLEKKLIIDNCLFQDDFWLYFNNIRNKNSIFCKPYKKFIPIKSFSIFKRKTILTDRNVNGGENQRAFIRIKKLLF
jgi:hypothetical protein